MANASSDIVNQLGADWSAVQTAARKRVSTQRFNSASTSWTLWSAFCGSIGVDSVPGRGSSFWLRLACAGYATAAPVTVAPEAAETARGLTPLVKLA